MHLIEFNWEQERRLGNVVSLFVLRIDGFTRISISSLLHAVRVYAHTHAHKYTRALFILNAFTSSEPSCFERVLFLKTGRKSELSFARARAEVHHFNDQQSSPSFGASADI